MPNFNPIASKVQEEIVMADARNFIFPHRISKHPRFAWEGLDNFN